MKNQTQFGDLLAELARALKASPPPSPSLHAPTVVDFTVDDVVFSVVHAPLLRPDQMLLTRTLGSFFGQQEGTVLKRMLELNFALAGSTSIIGMNPANGDIVLTTHASVAATTPGELADTMRNLAVAAQALRDSCFGELAVGQDLRGQAVHEDFSR